MFIHLPTPKRFLGEVNHGAASDWSASFFTINVLFFREGRDP